jgi:DNA-binding XRE family transcriptional regulator
MNTGDSALSKGNTRGRMSAVEPDETSPPRPWDPPWLSRTAHRSLDPRVSAVLAERRAELGWNRSEASRQTGVSRPMILALERGERRPSVSLAEAVIDGYRLDAGDAAIVRSAALDHVGRDSPFRHGYRSPRQARAR